MKITTTIVKCDILDCGKENSKEHKLQVIFETEQTEGRSCKPYLSNELVDLCDECFSKVLKGQYIFAYGAQGYNKYYFKD